MAFKLPKDGAALICGSVAYDTILLFPDRFKAHILPDKLHTLNVSFLVPEMRREFGGCAANIAYGLKLLGDRGIAMATALTSALTLPDPTNLIQVVLRGVNANEGIPGVVMPSFAQGFSDSDIARLKDRAAAVRQHRPDRVFGAQEHPAQMDVHHVRMLRLHPEGGDQ